MNYSVTIMPDIRRMTPETPEGVIIEGILNEKDQIPGENLRPGQHIHVYVEDVKKTQKGATRIILSRKHPELVKYLFEEEVAEIRDGIVKIMAIAREAGSRTKIAVASTNPGVDPVGACVGLNGSRINTIVEELGGEKIDIITWDENPGNLIQNALSPAKVISVFADRMRGWLQDLPDTRLISRVKRRRRMRPASATKIILTATKKSSNMWMKTAILWTRTAIRLILPRSLNMWMRTATR